MYRVLLALDADEDRCRRAAEAVTALPGVPDGVSVLALNVFREFTVTDEGGDVRSADLYDEDDYPASVDAAVDILEAAGLEAERRREHGDPAAAIIEVADEIDADLIVMSGRRRSPAGKVLFGSVAQGVLLGTDRPVEVAMAA